MARRDVAFELSELLKSRSSMSDYMPEMAELLKYTVRYIRSLEECKRHDAKLIRDLKRRGYCDERLRAIRGNEDVAEGHFSQQGGPCAGCGY